MDQLDFVQDPVDLTDALNEDEDNIFSINPVAIKSSDYFEFGEFLNLNSSPQFYKKKCPCSPLIYVHYMGK